MTFESLPEPVRKALRELDYTTATAIQEKAIPLVLEGRDVVGQSETGSGKTAAFGTPILGKLHGRGVQMLVLTPTRELCVQVRESLGRFARYLPIRITAVYGGVGMGPQIKALKDSQVVVATPGRLLDHLNQRTVDLRDVKFLVLDEADRMLDMGFIRDVEKIIGQTSRDRQTLLFSATLSNDIKRLVHKYLRNPEFIETATKVDKSKLHESYYEVRQDDKYSLLVHLLKNNTGTVLVFCGTRRTVDRVVRNLGKEHIEALAIHGGLSQNKRDQAIGAIKGKHAAILIATDVAARGLHISHISHVFNYDLPNVSEDYTHRIGRTARAGAEGDAVSLITDRDRDNFRGICRLGHVMTRLELPEFDRIVLQNVRPIRESHGQRRFGGGQRYGGRSEGGSRGGYGRSEGGSRYGQRSEGSSRYGRGEESSRSERPAYSQRSEGSQGERPAHAPRSEGGHAERPAYGQRSEGERSHRPSRPGWRPHNQKSERSSEGGTSGTRPHSGQSGPGGPPRRSGDAEPRPPRRNRFGRANKSKFKNWQR